MSCDVAIVIQARLKSERLPRKILADIGGRPMLAQIIRRCDTVRIEGLQTCTVLAVPIEDMSECLEHVVGIQVIGGPEWDLLSRLLLAADATQATKLVRVTSDCPMVCPRLIEGMINHAYYCQKPVVTNWSQFKRTFPNGLDLEVYDVAFLRKLSEELKDEADREYFAQWIVNYAHANTLEVVDMGRTKKGPINYSHMRLTVDYAEDLEVARAIYKAMGREIWDGRMIISWLEQHPEILKLNAMHNSETGSREENEARRAV